MTYSLAWHLHPSSIEGPSAPLHLDFTTLSWHTKPASGETPSLKLRTRNGKEFIGSKIMNMENQMRSGQEASRSRCFKLRTPKGLCGAEGWRVPGKCTRAVSWKARVRCREHLNLQIHGAALFHATWAVAALITQKNKSSIQELQRDGSQDTEGFL